MSTRKTTAAAAAAAAAAAKVELHESAPKEAVDDRETVAALMGANTSTSGVGEQSGNETESSKVDVIVATKQIVGEPKRITRNSPLFLLSPTAITPRKEGDSEPTNSESEDGGSVSGRRTSSTAPIRGRKSLKEAKEAKELVEKAKEEAATVGAEQQQQQRQSVEQEHVALAVSGKEDPCDLDPPPKEINHKEKTAPKDTHEKEARELAAPSPTLLAASSHATSTTASSSTSASSAPITIANRLTRKSATAAAPAVPAAAAPQKEVAASTRITRNRPSSTSRPETPPAAPQRRGRPSGSRRTVTTVVEPAATATTSSSKRKRSGEEPAAVNAELGAKYIKVEVREEVEAMEDELPPPQTTASMSMMTAAVFGTDSDDLRLKQELIESDECSSVASSSPASTTTTNASSSGRGRSRWNARRPQAAAGGLQVSPSTRSTRQTKLASPSPSSTAIGGAPTEPKRRRTVGGGGGGSTVTRSSSASLLKSAAHVAAPDEDSKDSMASSMDELLLADIKLEKFTPELEETDYDMEEKTTPAVGGEEKAKLAATVTTAAPAPNGVHSEPLTVDTAPEVPALGGTASTNAAPAKLDSAGAACTTSEQAADKAASLSPELVSEGVSEISVKQFYKKPKFLENNLGIEEDPKLGEIVQQVSTEKEQNNTGATEAAPLTEAETEIEAKAAAAAAAAEQQLELPEDDDNLNDSISDLMMKGDEQQQMDDTISIDVGEEPKYFDDGTSTSMSDMNVSHLIIEEIEEEETETDAADEDCRSMLIIAETEDEEEEEDNDDDDEEDAAAVDAAVAAAAAELEQADKVVVSEETEVEDGEDDLTVEESETISMDNNPSVHDDAVEEREEELDEIEELDGGGGAKAAEKTKTDCDKSDEAKLVVDATKATKLENNAHDGGNGAAGGDNVAAKSTIVKVRAPALAAKSNTNKENAAKRETGDKRQQQLPKAKVKTAAAAAAAAAALPVAEDDVLARIDAELKKIGEKLKEKRIDDDGAPSAAVDDDDDMKADEEKEDNKENVAAIGGEESANDDATIETKDAAVKASADAMAVDDDELKEAKVSKKKGDIIPKSEPIDEEMVARDEDEKLLEEVVAAIVSAHDRETTPCSSSANSPSKCSDGAAAHSARCEDDAVSYKSGQSSRSSDSSSWVTLDPLDLEMEEDAFRQKEQHLQKIGLLTHKAAEKRRQEYVQNAVAMQSSNQQQPQQQQQQPGQQQQQTTTSSSSSSSSSTTQRRGHGGKTSAGQATSANHEYTGTLKTVIKLNRHASVAHTSAAGNGRKGQQGQNAGRESTGHGGGGGGGGGGVRRQSLKMTFQKGRARGQGGNTADRSTDQHAHGEDAYYTIQNENEGGPKTAAAGASGPEHSYSSSAQTHDSSHSEGQGDAHSRHDAVAGIATKKDEKEEILIPEKASSFKFHPGRLCEDQCYYCSGKFGLYDTPCHVGQIKSAERQQKILQNEEKLTVDNCLCDACFRHVDRRANVPSYKKRLSAPAHLEAASVASGSSSAKSSNNEDGGAQSAAAHDDAGDQQLQLQSRHKCVVPDCRNPAVHSLRRKCIRKSVKKFLLNFEMPTAGTLVWLCQAHYDTVIQCSGCVLCKRRLGKNHMYHITTDTDRLERALKGMGIPAKLDIGTAVCKLCRYFANLLMKPPDHNKSQKTEFVKNYRKRLLQFHNILLEDHKYGSEVDEEASMQSMEDNSYAPRTPQKKRGRRGRPCSSGGGGGGGGSGAGGSGRGSSVDATPNKQLPSPGGSLSSSASSSVECLDDCIADGGNAALSAAGVADAKQRAALADGGADMHGDYDNMPLQPMESTDSNSSGSPTPPSSNAGDAAAGLKQMSKLKAILQQSTHNSNNNNNNSNNNNNNGTNSGKTSSSASDISNALRSNPNISMRELFPGEEDLGLQFKAPFGSGSAQRTPEGWTRVQTFLQYDEPTRRLWEELQKPYGNQSSFLRHLILLEKYYRNGELILSPNASSNASVYTQTVRQRLTSYDHGHGEGLHKARPERNAAGGGGEAKHTTTTETFDDQRDGGGAASGESSAAAANTAEEGGASHSGECAALATSILGKRLRSRSASVDKLTKQLSTNAVTIIARPKEPSQPQKSLLKAHDKEAATSAAAAVGGSTASANLAAANAAASAALAMASASPSNSRSILKTNLLGMNNKAVEILPIVPLTAANATIASAVAAAASKAANAGGMPPETKQQKILEVAYKLLGHQEAADAASASAAAAAAAAATSAHIQPQQKLLTSPPELVSLQRRSSGTSGVTSSAVTGIAAPSLIPTNKRPPTLVPSSKGAAARAVPPNVVVLPDTLSQSERVQSKLWRPTLMPVEENQHLLNKNGPLYQTADGRRLPALVQVQSGGKPFLISIFDYNRMCILRREKILRDQMLKANKSRQEQKQQQQQQQQQQGQGQEQRGPQQQCSQQQSQQQQQQQHQQQQQMAKNASAAVAAANAAGYAQQYVKEVSKRQQQAMQQHQATQQLLQLQMMQIQSRHQHQQAQHQQHQAQQQQAQHQQQQQHQQQAAMKTAGARYQPIAPKPIIVGGGATTGPSGGGSRVQASTSAAAAAANNSNSFSGQTMMPMLANAITSAAATASTSSASAMNNASWLWNNFPDANQLLINGAPQTQTQAQTQASKMPHLQPKPSSSSSATSSSSSSASGTMAPSTITSKQHQQLLLENATLMSKIPKSLTVIPQHKLMGASGSNAAPASAASNHRE